MTITSLKRLLAPDLAATSTTVVAKTLSDINTYANVSQIPTTGITTGTKSFLTDDNTLYVWNGTAWDTVATLSGISITQGADPSYEFAADGTPVVITFTTSESVTWTYSVTSGSLTNGGGTTATVEQADNQFTITPATDKTYDGTFTITFVGTGADGVVGDSSEFTLALGFQGNLKWTLDNPNAYLTSSSDQFGRAVAISGNYAIVGAPFEDEGDGTDSGKAYIFDVTTGSLVHTLDNPNAYDTSVDDYFGYSVAISGNSAIVGARDEEDTGGSNSGKAYIFDVTTGTLLHTLDNPTAYSTSRSDYFSYSVAISESYAIVGAYGEDDAGGSFSGKAYIFDVTTGSLLHTLDNPNAYDISQFDYFGISVAISGNYAIVGAYGEDDAGGTNSGKAYIFDVTTGSLVHTLDNPNAYSTSSSDQFGRAVAISGNSAIVGAYQEDDAGGTDSGKAYIFDVTTGALVHTLDNPNAYSTSLDDYFGFSVGVSGNKVIVGAYQEDDAGGTSSGKAYIFR